MRSTRPGILVRAHGLTGLLVGWSVNNGVVDFLIGVLLLVVFAFTMSWVGIWLGLSVPTVEVGQQVAFVVIFPITFISNAFVPVQTMPTWLQPFAEWNPVSTLTASLRILWGNPNPFATNNLPSQQPILVTLCGSWSCLACSCRWLSTSTALPIASRALPPAMTRRRATQVAAPRTYALATIRRRNEGRRSLRYRNNTGTRYSRYAATWIADGAAR